MTVLRSLLASFFYLPEALLLFPSLTLPHAASAVAVDGGQTCSLFPHTFPKLIWDLNPLTSSPVSVATMWAWLQYFLFFLNISSHCTESHS